MKMVEARHCLELAERYMVELDAYAQRMANITVTDEALQKILDEMFPVGEDDSERKKNSVKQVKQEYMICYFAPDIQRFRNTGWGVLNAMSDMIGHCSPRRNTENYRENNWNRIMDGHAMLDKLAEKVGALA